MIGPPVRFQLPLRIRLSVDSETCFWDQYLNDEHWQEIGTGYQVFPEVHFQSLIVFSSEFGGVFRKIHSSEKKLWIRTRHPDPDDRVIRPPYLDEQRFPAGVPQTVDDIREDAFGFWWELPEFTRGNIDGEMWAFDIFYQEAEPEPWQRGFAFAKVMGDPESYDPEMVVRESGVNSGDPPKGAEKREDPSVYCGSERPSANS